MPTLTRGGLLKGGTVTSPDQYYVPALGFFHGSAVLPDGTIVGLFKYYGAQNTAYYDLTYLAVSTDGGQTWANPINVYRGDFTGYINHSLHADERGNVFLAMDAGHGGDTGDWFIYGFRWTGSSMAGLFSRRFVSQSGGTIWRFPKVISHSDPSGRPGSVVHILMGQAGSSGGQPFPRYFRWYVPDDGSTATAEISEAGGSGGSFPQLEYTPAGPYPEWDIEISHTGDGKTTNPSGGITVTFVMALSDTTRKYMLMTLTWSSSGGWAFASSWEYVTNSGIAQLGGNWDGQNGGAGWALALYLWSGSLYLCLAQHGGNITIYRRPFGGGAWTLATTQAITNNRHGTFGRIGNTIAYVSNRTDARTVSAWCYSIAGNAWEEVTTLAAATGTDTYSQQTFVAARLGGNSRLPFFHQDPSAPSNNTGRAYLVGVNAAPTAATPTTPAAGSKVDRTNPITLAWVFNDPDAGDSQSKSDLQYKLTSASTWTSILGATTTATSYALPANQAAGDYEWQVRTYDSQGVMGPWSTSSFFTAASPPTTPTITAPTSGGTISTASYTVTWSAPQQDAYEVRRVADASGSPGTTVYSTTGVVEDNSSRARTLAFDTNQRAEHVQVRVTYQGITSAWASNRATVSYTAPPTPVAVLTPDNDLARMLVAITNPTPTGSQPAVASVEVWVNDGLGEGLTRRAVNVTPNSTFSYDLPRSYFDYQGNIMVRAIGANGTTSEALAT